MSKKTELLELVDEADKALEAALRHHDIEVAYMDLTQGQDEAWQALNSKLNTLRGMIMAYVHE